MIRKLLSCLILGALAGGVTVFYWIGKDLDRLYLEVSSLKMQCNELVEENFRLSSQFNKPQTKPIIRNILVETTKAPDPLVEIRAIKFVKQKLSHLLGEELDSLKNNPRHIPVLLEGATMSVDKKEYRFHVDTVVIGETLYVRVKLNPYTPTGAKAHAIQ